MQIDVRLKYQYGYSWFTQNGVSVKGYAWNDNNELLREAALASLFESVASADDFQRLLCSLNGLYAIILQKGDSVLLATDRTRTFPLFYTERNGVRIVSDSAYEIAGGNWAPNEVAINEFQHTGYVTGRDTFFQDVYQLQAGAYMVLGQDAEQRIYHVYGVRNKINLPFDALALRLNEILDAVILRLIGVLNGRPVVLPLSGGYDSRLIACLLKKHRYERVICFTYGNKIDKEVQWSQQIATTLGFPWHFVDYSDRNLNALVEDSELDAYIPFCTNGVSSIFLQDYWAVKSLKQKGVIPADAVFVPGHTGDFISGGHLIAGLNEDNLCDAIIKRHYTLRSGNKTAFVDRVRRVLQNIEPSENFEHWNLKERQAKFIVNSNRAYEFWGYQHLMPLWDLELVSFFQNIDMRYKLCRPLYDHVLFRDLFQPMGVDIRKERFPLLVQKAAGLYRRLYRYLYRDHYNFRFTTRYFTRKCDPGVRWNSTEINVNSVLAGWMAARLKEKAQSDRRSDFQHWM